MLVMVVMLITVTICHHFGALSGARRCVNTVYCIFFSF